AQRDWFSRGLSQTGGLDAGLARVFAAVTGSKVGHDHAYAIFRQMKGAGELTATAEWILGAGPDGELVICPFGNRRPGLQRTMLDVGNVVGFVQNRLGL